MAKMDLNFLKVDTGNCRVYYKDQFKNLYCFQILSNKVLTCGEWYTEKHVTTTEPCIHFELLFCSKDGEPSYPIAIEDIRAIDIAPDVEPIAKDLNRFMSLVKK